MKPGLEHWRIVWCHFQNLGKALWSW